MKYFISIIFFLFTFNLNASEYKLEKVISGLNKPWGMSFINDNELFLTQKSGEILKINLTTKEVENYPHNLKVVQPHWQAGMLDVIYEDGEIHKVKIIFEPGRSIIGDTGTLVSKIIYIKDSGSKKFIILDAAMNDLMRPALYGAVHKTLPVTKSNKTSKKPYEFVGPICESTDKFVTLKKFQVLNEKDLIAICDVGAYGMSLSSNYNLRPKPIELLIKGSKIKVIRKRQKHKDII